MRWTKVGKTVSEIVSSNWRPRVGHWAQHGVEAGGHANERMGLLGHRARGISLVERGAWPAAENRRVVRCTRCGHPQAWFAHPLLVTSGIPHRASVASLGNLSLTSCVYVLYSSTRAYRCSNTMAIVVLYPRKAMRQPPRYTRTTNPPTHHCPNIPTCSEKSPSVASYGKGQ